MRVSLLPRVTGDLSSYQLEMEPFARGMNGAFHHATERMSGRSVVIKRLARLRDGETAATLKREYQALHTLTEGPIVPVVGAKFDDAEPFISYERIKGAISLRAELRSRSLPLSEAFDLAIGVTEALALGHRLGVLHLGLRPANILVTRSKSGSVIPWVFDFGLARNVLLENASRWAGLDLERLGYVAPEQSRLSSGNVDQRADLYALGLVLFEIFTGRRAFNAENAPALLHQQIAKRPPSPSSLRGEISPALSSLLLDLLAKVPAERPPSAHDVLDALRSIVRIRASGAPERSTSAEIITQGSRLVGRSAEMEALSSAVTSAAQNKGRIVFLGGPVGSGKTSLLSDLQASYPEHLAIFASGNATEFERHLPFAPLQAALGQLVEAIRRGPHPTDPDPQPGELTSASAAILEAIGAAAGDLFKIAPGLSEVFGPIDEPPPIDPDRRTQRFLNLVIDLLTATARVFRRPVVLVLDNLQWADPSVHELLWVLASRISELPVAVIAGYRTGEVMHQLITQIVAAVEQEVVQRLELRPFDLEETTALISSYLHGAEVLEPLPSTVHRLTLGNPLHTLQLLKQLLSDGALSIRDGQTQIRSELLERAPLSMSLAAVIEQRAAALDQESTRILAIGALLGSSFEISALREAARAGETSVRACIDAALALELVEQREDHVAFVHDRMRECFVHKLDGPSKRGLHERLGRRILDSGKNDEAAVFAVAHHLSQGEHPAQAVPFLITAAKLAQSRYAPAQAAGCWRAVLDLEPDHPSGAERLSRHESYADCCKLLGRYDEAQHHYRQALALAASDLDRARLEGKVGDVYFRTGHTPNAIRHLEAALRSFGEQIPKKRIRLWFGILIETLIQVGHTIRDRLRLPRLFSPRFSARIAEVAGVYHKLSYASYFTNLERTLHAQLRQINVAEGLPEIDRAQVYSDHAVVCGTIPLLGRALRYAKRALELRRVSGDRWGIGQSHSFLGVVHYYRGEYAEARRNLREAIQILDGLGDPWEIETACSHLYFVTRFTGDFDEGVEGCERLLRLSQEIKDIKFQSVAWSGLAKLSLLQGKPEKALDFADRALALEPDPLLRAVTYCTKAQVYLRRGDLLEAKHAIEQSLAIIKSGGLRNDYVTEAWIVAAEIEVETLRVSYARRRHRRAFAVAQNAVELAQRGARRFPNYGPASLRVAGVFAAVKGEPRRAHQLFDRGVEEALRLGQRYELGRILDEAGRTALEQGRRHDADERFIRAEKIFRELGAQLDLQAVLERLGRAVRADAGRADVRRDALGQRRQIASLYRLSELVSSLRDVERLLDHVMDIAIEATGAERGFLMLYEDERQPRLGIRAARNVEQRSIDFDPLEIHRDVIEGVEHTLEPRIAGTDRCSVLCVPLRREDRLLGLIYVDNRLIGDLFTRHDLEVLSSFAALVAVTIENAYHYKKIEELNANLEERIRARTHELQSSEERFRHSIEEANDAIFTIDPHRAVVLSANRVALEWIGAAGLRDVIGRDARDLVIEEDHARLEALLAAPDSQKEAVELTIRRLNTTTSNENDLIPAGMSSSSIHAASTTFVQIICRDLREQRRLHRQLLQSEKLASIGQLAAGVAHEIRNPLNGISLAVALVKRMVEKGDNDKLGAKLSDITREIDRANKHISDLLLYSRPRAPTIEHVTLSATLEDALRLVDHQITLQDITVERDYGAVLPRVAADPHLLQQVFVNLLINAAQAMPGGGKLTLRLRSHEGRAEAEIRDTGHGIAPENIERIFDPFFTTKEPGKGTGLGLSICQAALRKLGGTIRVESTVGAGTRFTVGLRGEVADGA